MGIRIQVENFGENRGVRYQFIEKRYTYALHMHQFIELFILLEGELEITVDNRCETIHAGEGAVILPYQPHKFYSKTMNKLAIFVFSHTMIPDFSQTVNGMTATNSVFLLKNSTLESLRERIFDKSDFSLYDIKSILYQALGDFLEQTTLTAVSKKLSLPAGVMQYILDHLTETIMLEDLAKSIGYTPQYLSSLINEIFNMNFTKVVACVRVDKARHLLRETNKTLAEICYECGFGSERSFHRQFKEITTFSPKQYRNLILSKSEKSKLHIF